MVYESKDHGNDVTCQAVPVVFVLVFHKNNFTPGQRSKRTKTNQISAHGETFLTVSWCLKLQKYKKKKYEKQQKKTSLRAVCEKLRRKQKINVIVKNKSTTDNFTWSTLL